MGAYFVAVRPPLLPEDERAIGMTLVEAERNVPGLALWLDRVFAVLGVDEDEPSRFDPTLTGLPARPLAGDVRPRLLSRPYGFF